MMVYPSDTKNDAHFLHQSISLASVHFAILLVLFVSQTVYGHMYIISLGRRIKTLTLGVLRSLTCADCTHALLQ